jgi:hypothetical protein
MNERNVEALLRLIRDTINPALSPDDDFVPISPRAIAENLAADGVLVPAALTGDECDVVVAESVKVDPYSERPAPDSGRFRAALERIAKGLT